MAKKKLKKLNKKTAETISEKLEKGWIRFSTIVEMMGAPKDYLTKSLRAYVDKLRHHNDLFLIDTKYAKPKKRDQLFSTFVEIEMMARNAGELMFFCFDFMPVSVEIIEPENVRYSSNDFGAFLNDTVARLHTLDAHIKTLKARSKNLETNAALLLRNNVLIILKDGEKSLEELSKGTGIPGQQLSPFLEKLISENWIKRSRNKYSRKK